MNVDTRILMNIVVKWSKKPLPHRAIGRIRVMRCYSANDISHLCGF